jgi:nitroreductase
MNETARPDLLATLLARQSVPVPQLGEPGPTQAAIDLAIDLALRAPDHNQCKPWLFRLIRGAARNELAELLASAAAKRNPALTPQQLERMRMTPLTAPLCIAVGAALNDNPKVPEIEQLFSVATAVMNLLNGFHLQGYGAIWLTGANSYDPVIAHALGFAEGQRHLGFVYVGTKQGNAPLRARPARDAFVSEWTHPVA